MRQGQNPLKFLQAPATIKPIVFLVVTHLPDDGSEYHAERFEIVKTCLETMRDNSHRDHTFMIWDNGSGETLRNYIRDNFKPDIFIQSANLGKGAARMLAVNMLPPATVICYSDDDFLFYANWLKPQMELLNHFPNVAAVSGYPVRTMFRSGNINTIAWAKKNASVKIGQFIPRDWENDFALSVGRDPQQHIEMTVKDFDTKITYQGKEAYATAHHAQFIGYQVKISQAVYMDGMAEGNEHPFDIELDKIGLRLCTTERLCRHMGNVMDEKLRNEIMVTA